MPWQHLHNTCALVVDEIVILNDGLVIRDVSLQWCSCNVIMRVLKTVAANEPPNPDVGCAQVK